MPHGSKYGPPDRPAADERQRTRMPGKNSSSRQRPARDELFFPGMRVLCLSSAAGLSGGPYFDPCGIPDFVRRFDRAGGQLLAPGGGFAIRGGGRGADATDLSGAVFVRVFL